MGNNMELNGIRGYNISKPSLPLLSSFPSFLPLFLFLSYMLIFIFFPSGQCLPKPQHNSVLHNINPCSRHTPSCRGLFSKNIYPCTSFRILASASSDTKVTAKPWNRVNDFHLMAISVQYCSFRLIVFARKIKQIKRIG